jgi:16S rRNA (cytosine967-C5)-methyltransferase
MIAPARRAAYEVLRLTESGRTTLPGAIARIRPQLTDERDRALATEIVTGTLRWRGRLDFIIAALTRRPLKKLDDEVLDILRLGAYQLLHLDKVPSRAVVNDSVELTRRAGKKSAAGLVNATLRSLTRDPQAVLLPSREAPIDYLTITLSHPRWLAERWLNRYGFAATAEWMTFNNRTPALTIRANTLRVTPDDLVRELEQHGVRVRQTRYAAHGLVVEKGNPLRTPLADEGVFQVQDEASQLVPEYAAVRPAERVLDACAAPGGKTIALSAAAGDQGLVVAGDIRNSRMELMRATLTRAGLGDVPLVQHDLRTGAPFEAVFDCVLVDAPCSGLGTIRRDPEIRWRRHEEDLAVFAATQREIVTHAAQAVRPGGRLIYATCSSEPEENEQIADWFLDKHPHFRHTHPRDAIAEVPDSLNAVIDDRGRLRTLPHVHGLEAFFAATFSRAG